MQRAIDRMDDLDGDPDLGPDGDELDGSMAEDDFHPPNANWMGHAGCPVSDPGEDDIEDCCLANEADAAPPNYEWGQALEAE